MDGCDLLHGSVSVKQTLRLHTAGILQKGSFGNCLITENVKFHSKLKENGRTTSEMKTKVLNSSMTLTSNSPGVFTLLLRRHANTTQ